MNTLQAQLVEIAKGHFQKYYTNDMQMLEQQSTSRKPIDVLQDLSNQYGFAVAMVFKGLLQYQFNKQGEVLLNVAYYTQIARQQILNDPTTVKATVFVSHILNDLVAELGISKTTCQDTHRMAEHAIGAILYACYARRNDEDRIEQHKNSLNLLFANIEKLLDKPI